MKKSLLFIFGAASFIGATAQPTLTATGINPVAGDVYTVVSSTTAANPGSPGANQTWNLTSITGTSGTYSIVTAASTTHGSSFPGATLATSPGSAYYKTSSTAFQFYGSYGSTTQYYSNPEDFMHFPCAYNATFTDAFACTYTSSATVYRNGTVTVTADGWGTLTTPAGTFSNVMRVHMTESYSDTGSISGFHFESDQQTDEYVWYLNGNHAAIASSVSFTMTPFGSSPTVSQTSSYLTSVAVGIEDHGTVLSALQLFPNPASSALHIDVKASGAGQADLKIMNAIGETMSQTARKTSAADSFDLDVSTLPEGLYFAQLYLDGKLSETRRFIVAR